MLIITNKITHRIKFIFELIFSDMLNIDIDFTTNIDDFNSYQGAKISYGVGSTNSNCYFYASSLLFEKHISPKLLDFGTYKNEPIFFCTSDENSLLPFDIFAASFYLVSRYEEYLPFEADAHDRFPAEESVALKNNFLHKPLVNIWVEWLRNILNEKFQSLKIQKLPFRYLPTIDVDSAFKYKHKGFIRNLGGIYSDLKNNSFSVFLKKLAERKDVILNKLPDPFNTFDVCIDLHKDFDKYPFYFILLADFSKNNPNISYSSWNFRNIIQQLSDYGNVGIHPSYQTFDNKNLMLEEINRLQDIISTKINSSRQHFLRFRLPETYHILIDNNITNDYSMGYSQHVGYRASIAYPFYFFDLSRDYKTNLMIHPFAVMDGALKPFIKTNESVNIVKQLVDELYEVGGVFTTVWHNHALTTDEDGTDWLNIYKEILNYLKQKQQ
ncbi:MAG: polysaccharide deacetylase family protein [Bacteroidales bacterium]